MNLKNIALSVCLLCVLAGAPAVAQTVQTSEPSTNVPAQQADQTSARPDSGAPQAQAQPQPQQPAPSHSNDRFRRIHHMLRITILVLLLLLITNRRRYRRW